MIKLVPASTIKDDDTFPYDFKRWDYPTSLLRSCLYTAWWTEVDHDGVRYVLLMDYDGFIEWYTENEPKWSQEEGLTDDERFTAEEYLPYHLGRTISVVKEVTE